jgi:adenine-specific DNA methylase
MDTESKPGNFEEERIFEIGFVPGQAKFLFIDITFFISLLKPCFDAVGSKLKKAKVEKLLTSVDWHEHYTSKISGNRVLAESDYMEHGHELKTASSLADKGYDILFAPKGMFQRTDKKFDIFIIKDHVLLKADLKSITSKNPDTIAKRILGGSDQASRIVIEICSDIEKKYLIDGLRSGVENNRLIKEIFLFYKNQFYKLPKELIKSRRIFDVIK